MAGMDYKIPTVLTSEELMEKAFHRASKIYKNGTNTLDTRKKTALAKVTASGDIIVTTCAGIVCLRIKFYQDYRGHLLKSF